MVAAAPAAWARNGLTTEMKAYYSQSGNFQLNHNVGVNYFNLNNLLDQIVQGTGGGQRIGLRIHVKELYLNLILNNKFDRANVSYRVCVCAALPSTSTDAFGELFTGGGFTGPHVISNSELLLDQTFPTNQGSNMTLLPNKERSFHFVEHIPINRSVVYNSDNTCATRLIAFVIAYDSFGTLSTDNIASVAQTSYRIAFTDA
jgi:hypothetical protein